MSDLDSCIHHHLSTINHIGCEIPAPSLLSPSPLLPVDQIIARPQDDLCTIDASDVHNAKRHLVDHCIEVRQQCGSVAEMLQADCIQEAHRVFVLGLGS